MQRRTAARKVSRALSLKVRRKPSLTNVVVLPKPQFEYEDTLVTQLRAPDVLSNCYEEYDGNSILNGSRELTSPRKHVHLSHPCHYDNNLVPLWIAFYNLDRRGLGSVLLGRLMNLSSLVGPILNERYITEKTVNEHFINSRLVTFNQYRSFIEKCVNRNPFGFNIDWFKLRNVCWSQCEAWHLQALPFEIPEGIVPHELNNTIYWLWCVFCQLTEGDTYPPSADYEEIELLLRKMFSSLGLLWEDHDDVSAMSGSSTASSSVTAEQNDHARTDPEGDGRVPDHETSSLEDHSDQVTETLLVTFQQFLSIISDMIGTEMILSPAFRRAVTQIYLTEVDGIIKTGWLSLKKPGTDTWRRRWSVIRKNSFEFYSNTLCDPMKHKVVLTHKMHVESLPDMSSHKHRFRLVEREGDFNIAWEAEMSSADAQHSHSWMLVLNLTMKIQQTGLTTKQIEVAERKLERHRRRESQLAAIEKSQEVRKTRRRLEEVRERWNLMQTKLMERAAYREAMMEKLEQMEEIYDKLQALAKKQSLLRKSDRKISLKVVKAKTGNYGNNISFCLTNTIRLLSAFPSFSDENDSSLSKEEKLLIKSRDDKLSEHRKRFDKFNDEKKKLQEELLELQAAAMLSKDKEKTLILVYGPEKEADLLSEQQSTLAGKASNCGRKNNTQSTSHGKLIPIISVTNSSTSLSILQTPDGFTPNLHSSVSHPELNTNGSVSNSGSSERLSAKNDIVSSLDSDVSNLSGERLV